ncbi:MAG: ATP-binding cassette domain-containing protein [Clostridium sp.]|nr:ATP-binding cassette domain-containing protein [Clostridium sp.]
MIQIQNLQYSYGKHSVLNNFSLELGEGELIFLLGANGAGKSTLFRCILGLLHDYQGDIFINGINTRSMSAKELARRISYIPQNHHPTFPYSVLDMVLMGTNHRLSPFSSPGPKEEEVALQALSQMGIQDFADRNFQELSGGEQQLVLIARALAQQGKILLMDEPTSALDYGNQIRVLDKAADLARQGYTILLSCHNPQQAFLYADRVIAMDGGNVVADGRPSEVLSEHLIRQLYHVPVQLIPTESGMLLAPVQKSMYRWAPDMIRFMEDAGAHTTFYAQVAQALADAAPQAKSVFDAGCGLGFSSLELAKRFEHVTASDISREALAVLRKNNVYDNLDILEGDFFAESPHRQYDAMLFCCFGSMDEILRTAPKWCSGTVMVVQKDNAYHRFSVGKVKQRRPSFTKLQEAMAATNIPFESQRFTVDMGQPLRSIEDGIRFFRTYSKDADPSSITEEYVKSRLSPSDDPQFPYYLPVEMPVGLLTFHTKDLAAYAKEEF